MAVRIFCPIIAQTRDPQHADDAQHHAEHQTRLIISLPHDLPPIAQGHFAQSHRANDQRGRLRAGVAAARNDQRQKQREHDRLARFRLRNSPSRSPSTFRRGTEPRASPRVSAPCARAGCACKAHPELPCRRTFWMSSVASSSATSSMSSIGDDADEHAVRIHHRQRRAIVFSENR